MALPALLRDKTADLLRLGYRFTDRLRAESDDPRSPSRVPLRFLGEDALLVRGAEGVRLFYDTTRIKRDGALPTLFSGGLFGKGSVHGLDDETHRVRKATFVRAAMDDAAVDALMTDVQGQWARHVDDVWVAGWDGSVYDAAVDVYGRAILRWAGVVTDDVTATRLARDEAAIVDGSAVVGPAFVRSKLMRRRCDAWFTDLVRRARAGTYPVRRGSALDLVLNHVDADGRALSDHLAAVEIQNVIRPTIAVARFAAFAALALHTHGEWRDRLRAEVSERGTTIDGPVATAFAQEVRRYFPFVPLLPGVARQDLTFEGASVAEGERVLLDFHGTLHDERHWDLPGQFDPDRFLDTDQAFAPYFIPQGGGDVQEGHRCPGEKITVGLLAVTVAELACLDYEVPAQDFSYRMGRMPTAPREGVRLARVRRP